jgi:hypothetical protein
MGDGSADPQVTIKATIDPGGASTGGAQVEGSIRKIGDAADAVQGPLTQAEAAAKRFGVSVQVAQAAIDQLAAKEQDRAAGFTALASSIREASAANEESAEASKDATVAEETQAEAAERLNKVMGEHMMSLQRNAFYIHKFAEGLKDLATGGRQTGQAFMDIAESLQYMAGPQVAMYAALAQVPLMLVTLAMRHREVAGEARAHAEAEKSAAEVMKDAWKDADAVLKQALDNINKQQPFRDLLADAASFTKELRTQEDAANALQAALDRLADAQFGVKEQLLNLQEQQALKGKSGPEEKSIRDQYDVERQQLIAQHEADKAAREQAAKAMQVKQLQDQLDAALKQVQDNNDAGNKARKESSIHDTGLENVPSDYQATLDRISALEKRQGDAAAGKRNEVTDQPIAPLTTEQEIQLQTDKSALPFLKQRQLDAGPQFDLQLKAFQEQRDALKKQVSDLLEKAKHEDNFDSEQDVHKADEKGVAILDLEDIIRAITDRQHKLEDAQKLIEEKNKANDALLQKDIPELKGKLAAAKVDVTTAAKNVEAAGDKGQAGILGAQNKQSLDQAQAKLEAQRQAYETQINNLQALLAQTDEKDTASRAATEKKIADLQAQLDLLSSPNESPALAASKANKTEATVEKSALREKAQQDKKNLDTSIEAAKKAVEASGNKQAIEALKLIAGTLQDKQKELAELQALGAAVTSGKFQVIDQFMQTTRQHLSTIKDGIVH